MPSEPAVPRLAPPWGVRLAWWLAIFFAPQLPLVYAMWPHYRTDGFTVFIEQSNLLLLVLIHFHTRLIDFPLWVGLASVLWPFAAFLSHLILTLRVYGRRKYLLLMGILTGIILLDASMCIWGMDWD